MIEIEREFSGKLWLYGGKASWYFVTLPADLAEEIRTLASFRRRGWGSVAVEVTIGATQWNTSIFPDSDSGSYVLPVKAKVRSAEKLQEGDEMMVRIKISMDPLQ